MRFKLLYILVFVALFSCKKEQANFQTSIIAHAGNGLNIPNALFPDNTIDAIQHSLYIGADGVEIDIQLTKDGKFVLFHSTQLGGKTNFYGCVHDYTAQNLVQNAKYLYFQNQALTLLDKVDVGNRILILDTRHFDYCSNSVLPMQKIVQAIQVYALQHNSTKIIVNSNYLPLLDTLNKIGLKVSYNAHSYQNMVTISNSKHYPYYTIRNKEVSELNVKKMQNKGYKIILFDIRSQKGNKSALKKHPDILMTDKIEAALRLK